MQSGAASAAPLIQAPGSIWNPSTRKEGMYTASCHCGAVTLEMQRKPRKMTQCNCSLCKRYGALWAYFQRKTIRIQAQPNALDVYSWGDQRFEFFRCSICGCVTHYERTRKRTDASDMGAINLRNIDDPDIVANVPIRLLDGASSWKVLSEHPQPYLLRSPTMDSE